MPQILPDRTYDLVTMIQVIPHFYDLHQAIKAANNVTKPVDHWLIETWKRERRPIGLKYLPKAVHKNRSMAHM